MSAADFQAAFTEYLAKVGTYNTAQRGTLLNAFKEATAETLSAIGAPLPEGSPVAAAAEKTAEPAKAAAAADATPAKAAASSVTGAKPSSRVAQAPGGTSSINLGGGEDRPVSHHGRKQLHNTNQSSIQFGASEDGTKSSTRVSQAPGGGSSVQFGDDSTPAGAMAKRGGGDDGAGGKPKKPTGRKQLQAAGGQTHDVFNQKDASASAPAHTSIKTNQAPGGGSSISLAHDSKPEGKENGGSAAAAAAASAAAASGDVPPALLKEIIAAVYRKGKVKDTFTKFTGNKGKALSTGELKDGVISLGIASFSDAQAATVMSRFAADAKTGMTFPEFMKMMSA